MSASFLIGVDGGGTGCRVLIKNTSTGKLVRAEGGPANAATNMELAIRNVKSAIKQAAKSHGEMVDITAHIGLAGVYDKRIAAQIEAAFSYPRMTVSDDRIGAMEGSLGGGDGFLVAAGTGMILGSMKSGSHRFIGGHGFQVSDHGSGAWIGRRALDLTLRCCDGVRRHSDLTRQILADFKDDPHEIVAFSLAQEPSCYAALAPVVVTAGQNGDLHGVAILEEGARHISEALQVLGYSRGDRLCLTGGVGPHYVAYLPPRITEGLVIAEGSALDGALSLAARLRGRHDA